MSGALEQSVGLGLFGVVVADIFVTVVAALSRRPPLEPVAASV